MRTTIRFAMLALVACDPVHADQVDALGGDPSGARNGPLHRPGQPCIVCHDGALGDPQEFSVAGTVFAAQDSASPASNVTITLTSSDGSTTTTRSNAAGNFYLQPREYTPVYPMKVSVAYGGVTVQMVSRVGREGSCSFCHRATAGPTSAGRIFVPSDGVTP